MTKLIFLRLRFIWLLLFFPTLSYAQLFEVNELLQEGLTNTKILWGDFNNKDSLDVLVTGTNKAGEAQAMVISNIWRTSPRYMHVDLPVLTEGSIFASDMNNDDLPDILISGKDENQIPQTLLFFTNNDLNLTQSGATFMGLYGGNSLIVDLNNDGIKDIFINGFDAEGKPKVVVYKNSGNLFTEVQTLFEAVGDGTALVLDSNKDGLSDLVLTGIDEHGSSKSILYENNGSFVFTKKQELPGISTGGGAVGDFDHDGFTDVVLTGVAEGNLLTSSLYLNKSGKLELGNIALEGVTQSQVFIADMNHDGNADIIISGLDANNEYKTTIYFGESNGIKSQEGFSNAGTTHISIGDADRDGNPDLFLTGVSEDGEAYMNYLHNLTETPNVGPFPASKPVVIPMRGKAAFFWEPAEDDVSPSKSLTYDVFVLEEGDGIKKVPDANLASGYRKVVGHGSQHQDTTWFMTGLQEGVYDWGIVAVDNAFRGDGNGGVCSGGSFRMCFEISSSDTTICEKGPIVFNLEDGPKHIYSTNNGYLGFYSSIEYEVNKKDTLYFVSADPMVCTSSYELAINLLPEDEKLDLGDDLVVCKEEEVLIEPKGYFQVQKWLVNGEEKGKESVFQGIMEHDSEIILEVLNAQGCIFKDTINVEISPEFQIQVSDDATLTFGESIQLFASGGEMYSWLPVEGLSDPNVPNPIANPRTTTTYTVRVKNNNGCEMSDEVKITVQTNLFVPNLFSPNGDGKNEAFKVYGGNVDNLVLQIFDRSGNLLYEGEDNDPFVKGWDGNKNGNPQPAGAYIWRIKGQNEDGSRINFNGKSSGTLNLVR